MSDEIVARLRGTVGFGWRCGKAVKANDSVMRCDCGCSSWLPNDRDYLKILQPELLREAADEIERLRRELNESRLEICLLRAPSTLAGDPADDAFQAFCESRGWSLQELADLKAFSAELDRSGR